MKLLVSSFSRWCVGYVRDFPGRLFCQLMLLYGARLGASIQSHPSILQAYFGYLHAIANLRGDDSSNRPRLLLVPKVPKDVLVGVPRTAAFDISEQVGAWIMSNLCGSSEIWHLLCFWAKYGRHPRLYLVV